MADLLLSPAAVLPGVLLVVLLLLVPIAVKRRRRSRSAATLDDRAVVEVSNAPEADVGAVMDSSRRSRGRHLAVPPAPSGALLLLGPTAAKRRRRPRETGPGLESIPTDSLDDLAVTAEPVSSEPAIEVSAAPMASEASPQDSAEAHVAVAETVAEAVAVAVGVAVAAEDVGIYRRRVNATIQAVTRRIAPGESSELIEARLLAAVDRLDGPVDFARPRLSPVGLPQTAGQFQRPPHTALPTGPAALPPEQFVATRAVGEVSPEADPSRNSPDAVLAPDAAPAAAPDAAPEFAGAQPEQSALEDAEVVLPVPPMASATDPRRRGLLRRGKAG